MTDKEFRRLNRVELVEMLCLLRENETRLKEENAELRAKLEDRRTRLEEAGSIAEAVLSLRHVAEETQKAADEYLAEVAAMREDAKRELAAAEANANEIINAALRRAAEIIAGAARKVTTDALLEDESPGESSDEAEPQEEHAENP